MTDSPHLRLQATVSVFLSGPMDMFLLLTASLLPLNRKKGQKRKHQKKSRALAHLSRSRLLSGSMDCFSHPFSCLPPLDGRTPTPGGRPTYTLSPHKTSKKSPKRKKKKKVKTIKYLGVLSYLLSIFYWTLFFSSIIAANIHRIAWANLKWAGDDGHQSEASTCER